ncbi:MAG: dihydrofolate reductase [Sphingomonadales bacterium]|nr:dihydrofolate reductase [Sphingomonadales bacterium]
MRRKRPKLVLVVAAARNGIIGKGGRLPWHIPEDLKHFRRITMGKPILMGRKTFESIGHPLPGRRNLVLTRNKEWAAAGVETVSSLDEAIALTNGVDQLMIIGGEQLYRASLPHADRIELTEVDYDFDGDTYFPIIPHKEWIRIQETPSFSRTEGVPVNFVTLESRREDKESYLNLELSELLKKYGEGRHIPGSGSAAALLGLLSARLSATVIKISYKKGLDRGETRHFRYIDHQINTRHLPELARLFEEDIKVFDRVMILRHERDDTTDARKRKNIVSKERRLLQRATRIPYEVSEHCVSLAEHALTLYHIGYRPVRGDSGAAVSSACAGALTACFVMGVNLSRFSKGAWSVRWKALAKDRQSEALVLIGQAINAVEELAYPPVVPEQGLFEM